MSRYEYASSLDKEQKSLLSQLISGPFEALTPKNKDSVIVIFENVRNGILSGSISVKDVEKSISYLTETEELVGEYLSKRASAFTNIEVLNFTPEYVSVTANVLVDKNYGLGQMEKEINTKLNLYLSPWIESDAVQMEIDQGLTKSQISNRIKSIEGVLSVSSIEINKSLEASKISAATDAAVVVKTLIQTLLVTSENHQLKCKHLL